MADVNKIEAKVGSDGRLRVVVKDCGNVVVLGAIRNVAPPPALASVPRVSGMEEKQE